MTAKDSALCLINDDEKAIIEKALFNLNKNTKEIYRTAIYIFISSVSKKPEDITPKDISNFFDNTCAENLTSGLWSRSYVRTITYAVRKYIKVRFSDSNEEKTEVENEEIVSSLPGSPATLLPTTLTVGTEAITNYMAEIAKFSRPLFMAAALAYGGLLAPKEVYRVRPGHLSRNEDRLVLSVGEGKTHRYIYLTEPLAALLINFLEEYGITGKDTADIFSLSSAEKGKVDERFRRMLEGIQYRFSFEGIDGKLDIQQFRTIALSSVSKQADYSKLIDYAKISRGYAFTVRGSYAYADDPESILLNAMANAGYKADYNIPDWIRSFEPIDDKGNSRFIAEFPV